MTSPWLFESVIHNMTRPFEGKPCMLDADGKKEHQTLEELPETTDSGVIMLPLNSPTAIGKMRQEGGQGAGGNHSGYKDSQRQQLTRLKEDYGTQILGPNTIVEVM